MEADDFKGFVVNIMAKSLPYFKFFCSEWSDGDITLEDYQTQGLFINICAYYWSNECVIELSKLKKKFRGYESTIDEIISSNLIKLKGDVISISFLDEQKTERQQESKIKSKGGLASAEARKLSKLQQKTNTTSTENQHVLNSCSTETQLLRKEKKREEEIIKEINNNISFNFRKKLIEYGFKENLVDDWILIRKNKNATDTETFLKKFLEQIELASEDKNEILEFMISKDWRSFEYQWLLNLQSEFKNQQIKNQKNNTVYENNKHITEQLITISNEDRISGRY